MSVVRETLAPFSAETEPRNLFRPYPLNADQFEALIGLGLVPGHVELIEGELHELPAQYVPHMRAKMEVAFRLRQALADAGLPHEVGAEGSVRVNARTMPQPDVIVWRPVEGARVVPIEAVALAVEVCDTTHAMDLGRKPALYGAAGLPEYWIVDLRARAATVMWSPGPDGYDDARTVPFGEELVSATLPVSVQTCGLG